MRMPSLPQGLAASAARGAGRLSQRLGRGGGTTLPGLVLTRLRPEATAEMALAVPGGVILMSGTNGKTTSARLVRAVLDADGARVAANTAGSNLERGVATTLLNADGAEVALFEVDEAALPGLMAQTALLNADGAEVALFEVDEAALPGLMAQTRPRVVTLMNLFRDQLDRYGELEHLIERWRDAVDGLDPAATVIYNADDPAVAEIAAGHPNTVSYGIEDPRVGRDRLPHAADTTECRRCGNPLRYDMVTISHLGRWSCERCDIERPQPDVHATRVELHGMDGQRLVVATPLGPIEVSLRLPGMHNSYNAIAATATALALDIDPETIGPALAKREAAFGRAERTRIGKNRMTTLLAKNPAGANENIRTMLLETHPLHALVLLNDRTADGQDVSWIWDVDYELLVESDRLASITVGGDRAYDMALRFRYAGLDPSRLLVTSSVPAALDAALRACGGGDLYVLPTYTALLELQAELSDRGLVPAFWEDQ